MLLISLRSKRSLRSSNFLKKIRYFLAFGLVYFGRCGWGHWGHYYGFGLKPFGHKLDHLPHFRQAKMSLRIKLKLILHGNTSLILVTLRQVILKWVARVTNYSSKPWMAKVKMRPSLQLCSLENVMILCWKWDRSLMSCSFTGRSCNGWSEADGRIAFGFWLSMLHQKMQLIISHNVTDEYSCHPRLHGLHLHFWYKPWFGCIMLYFWDIQNLRWWWFSAKIIVQC